MNIKMSRTYRKRVRVGICCGSNTEFYRNRTRRTATRNKRIMKNAVLRYDGEEIDEHIYEYKPPRRDSWREPTDGTYLYDRRRAERIASDNLHSDSYREYVRRKVLPKLKKGRMPKGGRGNRRCS